jgi:hypothetical protein
MVVGPAKLLQLHRHMFGSCINTLALRWRN